MSELNVVNAETYEELEKQIHISWETKDIDGDTEHHRVKYLDVGGKKKWSGV